MTKVLLVEDDQFLLKMYQKKFEVEGFEVTVAQDGEEGIEKAKSSIPDIIMMDIMMPKLGGIEALAILKSDPNLKNVPVIILTNLSSTGDADEAIKKGAVDYLVKSDYTPTQVVDKAKKVLGLNKS